MFYWLFYEKLFHLYSPFRVFQYSTFRTAMASFTACCFRSLLGPWLIARLAAISDRPAHSRGRSEVAPEESRHADHGRVADLRLDRRADAAVGQSATPAVWVALAGLVSFGAVGFLDDYTEGHAASATWA